PSQFYTLSLHDALPISRAFRGCRQTEIQAASQNRGVRALTDGGNLRTENFGFQNERGGIRPVADRGADEAPAPRETIGVNLRERDRKSTRLNSSHRTIS